MALWALLGEKGKWVPVSTQRFGQLSCTSSGFLTVRVTGVVGEEVTVRFARSDKLSGMRGGLARVISAGCSLGPSGEAIAFATSSGSCS